MKSLKFVLSALLATVFVSSCIAGGFIKLGDIKGESTDSAHQGWNDILSVSGLDASSTRDHSSGMATGKRQHKPITITKPVDKTTPMLAKGAAFGSSVCISSDGMLYTIEGAEVVSVTREGNVETITLSCASVTATPEGKTAPKAGVSSAARSVPAPQTAPATDHNSSRSNKTSN